MLQFIVDKKISSTQSSNHLGTNPYRDAVEPYPGGILASESETIPLAVMSTSPQRPTSTCNPSTSYQDHPTDLPDPLPVAVPKPKDET